MSELNKNQPVRRHGAPPAAPPWQALYRGLAEAIEWVLDVAVRLAAPYPEEVLAIENVRAYVRAHRAGEPATIAVDDVLLAFGIVIAAIDWRRAVPHGRRRQGLREVARSGWGDGKSRCGSR